MIQDFLKRIEIEEIASQIEISEEEMNKLADEVKRRWWEEEGKKILVEKGIIDE